MSGNPKYLPKLEQKWIEEILVKLSLLLLDTLEEHIALDLDTLTLRLEVAQKSLRVLHYYNLRISSFTK